MSTFGSVSDDTLSQITIDGRPIFYRRQGQGRPLLLLHGWGGSSLYWRDALSVYSASRDVIAPDLPGFGDSPPLDGPLHGQRLADLTLAFTDALGLEQFDLNGHSFSAGVSAYMAAQSPERVRRLILTSFSTFSNEFERSMVDQMHKVMALWMTLRRPWMAERRLFYRAVAGRFFYRTPADDNLLRESAADFLRMDKRTAIESAASSADPAINVALAKIKAPTLVIGSRQDNIMPPQGTPAVADLIPGARLIWIERCGHLPMIERPRLYHNIVSDFLA
jgi:pimeloyl-ACP methyl ester carboxylesterase